jgi:multidrug resistance efflux pump
MKGKVDYANIMARQAFASRRKGDVLDAQISELEKKIEAAKAQLIYLKGDRSVASELLSGALEEHAKALRDLHAAFSAQERFKNSPSEEIMAAFSEEILPDLDET